MVTEGIFGELIGRLEDLNGRLTAKDELLGRAAVRAALQEKRAGQAETDLSAAREELKREGLKCSLQEQRLHHCEGDCQALAGELHAARAQHHTLERTLQLTSEELSRAQAQLGGRVREVSETQSYYVSVLEAKEASIGSLQQLLTAQQRSAKEQFEVWEQERATLTSALTSASEAAERAQHAQQRAAMAGGRDTRLDDQAYILPGPGDVHQATALKTRLLEAEADNLEMGKRVKHLEAHLRDRERLLVKADKRQQELIRQQNVSSQHLGPSLAVVAGARAAEVALAPAGLGLQTTLNTLRVEAEGQRAANAQLELIQEAFEEERKRREKLRIKLSAKVADRDQQLARLMEEVQELRMQLSSAQQELVRAERRAAEGAASAFDAQAERGGAAVSLLRSELEGMSARHANATAAQRAAHEGAQEQERAAHAVQIRELEAQLRQLALGGGPRGLEAESAVRHLQAKCEGLAAELERRSTTAQQTQHSLFVVRAHWGGLRVLLGRLHQALVMHQRGNVEDRGLVLPQRGDMLGDLERELNPQHKRNFDEGVQLALSAGCQVVERALLAWQDLTTAHARSRMEAATLAAAHQAATVAVDQTGQAAHRTLRQAQEQAAESEREASAARMQAAELGEQLVRSQNAALQLSAQLQAEKARLAELQQSSTQSEAERKQLRLALQGSKGELEGLLVSKDDALLTAQRLVDDLKANVGILHVRLEHAQQGLAQVDELKAHLSSILAATRVPLVELAGESASGTAANRWAGAAGEDRLSGLLRAVVQSGGGGAAGLGVEAALQQALAGEGGSGATPDARLRVALDLALKQARGALTGCALTEAAHWGLSRGVTAVNLLRAQLKSLAAEVAAGRHSSAQLLVQELISLLGDQGGAPQARESTGRTGDQPVRVDGGQLARDLESARGGTLEAAGAARGVETLLVALQRAMPTWLQLVRAEAESSFKGEVSRVRALVGRHPSAAEDDAAPGLGLPNAGVGKGDSAAGGQIVARTQLHALEPEPPPSSVVKVLHTHITQHHEGPEEDGDVARLAGGLATLQADMSAMRLLAEASTTDRAALAGHAVAIRRRARRLAEALSAALPLPPDLARGLQDGLVGETPLMIADPQALEAAGLDTPGDMTHAQADMEHEEAAEKLFRASLTSFAELASHFLAHLEAAGAASGQAQLHSTLVEPLRLHCQQLEGQLASCQGELQELQGQVHDVVMESHVAAEAAADACRGAANSALEAAMATMRTEVEEVEAQVHVLNGAARGSLDGAAREWAGVASSAATLAARAVAALAEGASTLQDALTESEEAGAGARKEVTEMREKAEAQAEGAGDKARQAQSELEVTRQKLTLAQAAQDALEAEVMQLKRGLREQQQQAKHQAQLKLLHTQQHEQPHEQQQQVEYPEQSRDQQQ